MLGIPFTIKQRQYEVGFGRTGLHQRADGVVARCEGVAILAPLGVEEDGGVVAGVLIGFGWDGSEGSTVTILRAG